MSYVPVANAGLGDFFKAVFSCVTTAVYAVTTSEPVGTVAGAIDCGKKIYNSVVDEEAPKVEKTAQDKVTQALKSINWEEHGQKVGAGLRKEFEATMDKLFAEKIRPLLKDIDIVLKNRIKQADDSAKARLEQLNAIIEKNLQEADKNIKKVKSELIDYTFSQATEWRDETIEKVQQKLIDYTFSQASKWRDESIKQVKKELIDHTFKQLDELKKGFRTEIDHFFDRAEYLVHLLDCTATKNIIAADYIVNLVGKKYPMLKVGAELDNSISQKCYTKLGLKKPPHPTQHTLIFELYKCDILEGLTINTPVQTIAHIYGDLQSHAGVMAACYKNLAPSLRKYYTWQWLEHREQASFWANYQ